MKWEAKMDHLSTMLSFVEERAEEYKLSEKKLKKLELAVEEILVNIITHGYYKKGGYITIETEVGEAFKVTIKDKGIPFNPTQYYTDPKKKSSIEDRDVGGLGIYLIYRLVDQMSYERVGEENTLILEMTLD